MQMNRFAALAAPLLVLAPLACKSSRDAAEDPPAVQVTRPRVLHAVPAYPNSRLLDTTGTEEAERASYAVLGRFDSVSTFYRNLLPSLGWSIMNDRGDATALDLYARNQNVALWLHFEPRPQIGTSYTMIATNADTSTAQTVPGRP